MNAPETTVTPPSPIPPPTSPPEPAAGARSYLRFMVRWQAFGKRAWVLGLSSALLAIGLSIVVPVVLTLATIGDTMIVFPFVLLGDHGNEQSGADTFASGIKNELDALKRTFASQPGDEISELSAREFDPLSRVTDVVATIDRREKAAIVQDGIYTGTVFEVAPDLKILGVALPTRPVVLWLLKALHPKYVVGTIEHWGTSLRVNFDIYGNLDLRDDENLSPMRRPSTTGAAAGSGDEAPPRPPAETRKPRQVEKRTVLADPDRVRLQDGYGDVKLQSAIVIAKVSHSISSAVFNKMAPDALADLTEGIRAHRKFERSGSISDLLQAACKYQSALKKDYSERLTHLFYGVTENQLAGLLKAQGRDGSYKLDCKSGTPGYEPMSKSPAPEDREIVTDAVQQYDSLMRRFVVTAASLSGAPSKVDDDANGATFPRLVQKGFVSSVTKLIEAHQQNDCEAIGRHVVDMVDVIERWNEDSSKQNLQEELAASILAAAGSQAVAETLSDTNIEGRCLDQAKKLLDTNNSLPFLTRAELSFSNSKRFIAQFADSSLNHENEKVLWQERLTYYIDQKLRYLYSETSDRFVSDGDIANARKYVLKSALLGEKWLKSGVNTDDPNAPPYTKWLRASVGQDYAMLAMLDKQPFGSYGSSAMEVLKTAANGVVPAISRWSNLFLVDYLLSTGQWEAGWDRLGRIPAREGSEELLLGTLRRRAFEQGYIVEDDSRSKGGTPDLRAANLPGVGILTIGADLSWRAGDCKTAEEMIKIARLKVSKTELKQTVGDPFHRQTVEGEGEDTGTKNSRYGNIRLRWRDVGRQEARRQGAVG